MGQKVNPIAFRIGTTKTWSSVWYSNWLEFKHSVLVDIKMREFLSKLKKEFLISNIQIKRFFKKFVITVETAKPGAFIKSAGGGIANITDELKKISGTDVRVNVKEVKGYNQSASIIASNIAVQIKNRASHIRAIKKAMEDAMRSGVLGIKIQISGRIAGAEIARTETFSDGNMPLSTLRHNIDYDLVEVTTIYGVIGIKVWIFAKTSAQFNNNVK